MSHETHDSRPLKSKVNIGLQRALHSAFLVAMGLVPFVRKPFVPGRKSRKTQQIAPPAPADGAVETQLAHRQFLEWTSPCWNGLLPLMSKRAWRRHRHEMRAWRDRVRMEIPF